MPTKLIFWLLMILVVSAEVIGDIFFKKWVLENRIILLVLGFVVYSFSMFFWAMTLRFEDLSRAIIVFGILSAVAVSAVGLLVFHEELSLTNKIGLAVGLVGLLMIEW